MQILVHQALGSTVWPKKPGEYMSHAWSPYFGLFNQYLRNEPGQFSSSKFGIFESRQSGWCDLWRSCVMWTSVTRLHSVTRPPRRLTHIARVAPSNMARLSHAERTGVIGAPKGPPTPFFVLSFFFLLVSSVVAAPLVILTISPPYEACVVLNCLHELVSTFRWVRMSSLPSHLIVFWNFLFG
jgi:hypothetical protein